MRRYVWIIDTPGGRRGWDAWIGPVGVGLSWPLLRPAWNWGWWRAAGR